MRHSSLYLAAMLLITSLLIYWKDNILISWLLLWPIKQTIDLVQLIQFQGYPLKKNGKDYFLNCPWHDDKEASLVVSPDTNLWHGMGVCQTGGSVIDWVMKTQGVSFRLACEFLQKDPSLANNLPCPEPGIIYV